MPILTAIVTEVRESVRIRHDLELALAVFRRQRYLSRRFESDIGKSKKSLDPKIYIDEHKKIATSVAP